jgi:8-oxo-dGTP diphosphatase
MSRMNNNGSPYYINAAQHHVAVDCVIFGFDGNEIKLLLFKRQVAPFKGDWSLIGGFIDHSEHIEDGVNRILRDYVGLENIFLEQTRCYGNTDRDPGGRVLSIGHYALIPLKDHELQVVGPYQGKWFSFDEIPELILDHNLMIEEAKSILRNKAQQSPIGFELLSDKFTLPELKRVYDSIFERTLDKRNFRKKILSLHILDKLDKKDRSSSKKGAWLYRFNKQRYNETKSKEPLFSPRI